MKNSSKKALSTGKGNLVEVEDHSVSSFDAEKFLRKNPNLAVEILLLMATIDMTPSKFFEKIRIVFPGMETTHTEELVLLFLFLRGKSARGISPEKEERGIEV